MKFHPEILSWDKKKRKKRLVNTSSRDKILKLACFFKIFYVCIKMCFLKLKFAGLEDVLKMFSTRLQRNNFSSSRILKTSRKTTWRRLGRRKIVTLKTYWRRLEEVWPRRIYCSWPRRLEDVFWRQRRKTSSRRLKVLGINIMKHKTSL